LTIKVLLLLLLLIIIIIMIRQKNNTSSDMIECVLSCTSTYVRSCG
jgi:hypothetical protein